MQPLIPEVVHVGDDERQTLGLNYADLVPVLAKAIQEQQEIIEDQRLQLKAHEAEDTAMRARVDDLSRKFDLLAASIATTETQSLGSIEGSATVAQLTNGAAVSGRSAEVATIGN